MSWPRYLGLLLLLCLPAASLLLLPIPAADPPRMASTVGQGDYPHLKVTGSIVDNSLLITPNTGEGFSVRNPPASGVVRASLGFRVHVGFAGRVYLARRDGERLLVQLSGTGPSRDGVFLQRAGETVLLLDASKVMDPWRKAPYLRLVCTLGPDALSVELNGVSARVALPGTGWKPDLEVRPLADRGLMLVEDVALASVAPDGTPRAIFRQSFARTTVFTDLGLTLVARMGWAHARVVSLLLLLLAAALLDLVLLWLHRRGGLGRRLELSPMGWLTMTWPAQVLLLYMVRAGLRLPYIALAACVGVTLLARYMGLVGAGLDEARESEAPRRRTALLFTVGLTILTGVVWERAMPSPELALISVVFVLAAAALGRALPLAAWLLFVIQAAGGLLLFTSVQSFTEPVWLTLTGIPPVLAVLVHTLKGSPRGGRVARILMAVAACAALLIFLELGLVRIKGIRQHVTVKGDAHLTNLKTGLHGDPLGRLKGAAEVEVRGQRYAVDKPPGRFRLVCLGSSSTAGAGSEDTAKGSYPDRLQELLQDRGLNQVQVINAGIDGASLTQLKVYLAEVLLHLKPDLVLLYFGANMDRHEARAYYRELHALVAGAPHLRTPEQVWAALHLPIRSAMAVELFLKLRRSQLFMVARGLVDMAVQGTLDEKERISLEIPSVIPRSATELVQVCRRHRVPLLLVPEVLRTAILEPDNPDAGGIPDRTFHYTSLFRELARSRRADGVRFASVHGA